MDPQVVLRTPAPTGAHLIDLGPTVTDNADPRSDPATIRPSSGQLHDNPVTPVSPLIDQQTRRGIGIVHQNVQVTVVVRIGKGRTSSGTFKRDPGPGLRRDIGKRPIAEIAVKTLRLKISSRDLPAIDLRIDVAVGKEQVAPAVIVVIDKADTPT